MDLLSDMLAVSGLCVISVGPLKSSQANELTGFKDDYYD